MSPTSLKITQRELEIGAKSTLAQCLQMEFRLAYNSLDGNDFFEGAYFTLRSNESNKN